MPRNLNQIIYYRHALQSKKGFERKRIASGVNLKVPWQRELFNMNAMTLMQINLSFDLGAFSHHFAILLHKKSYNSDNYSFFLYKVHAIYIYCILVNTENASKHVVQPRKCGYYTKDVYQHLQIKHAFPQFSH